MNKNAVKKTVVIVLCVVAGIMFIVCALSFHHINKQLSPAYSTPDEVTELKEGKQYYCYRCNWLEGLLADLFFKGDLIETSNGLHTECEYYRIRNHKTKELLIAKEQGHTIICRFKGFSLFVADHYPAMEATIKDALDSLNDIYESKCPEDIERIVIHYPDGFQENSQKRSFSLDAPKEISDLWDVLQSAVVSDLDSRKEGHASIRSSDQQPSITIYFTNKATLFLSFYDLEGAYFQIEWGDRAFLSHYENEILKTLVTEYFNKEE